MSRPPMFAYAAVVLFTIALVLTLVGIRVGPLTGFVFLTAGLIAVSLHLAGIGERTRDRESVRGRRV